MTPNEANRHWQAVRSQYFPEINWNATDYADYVYEVQFNGGGAKYLIKGNAFVSIVNGFFGWKQKNPDVVSESVFVVQVNERPVIDANNTDGPPALHKMIAIDYSSLSLISYMKVKDH